MSLDAGCDIEYSMLYPAALCVFSFMVICATARKQMEATSQPTNSERQWRVKYEFDVFTSSPVAHAPSSLFELRCSLLSFTCYICVHRWFIVFVLTSRCDCSYNFIDNLTKTVKRSSTQNERSRETFDVLWKCQRIAAEVASESSRGKHLVSIRVLDVCNFERVAPVKAPMKSRSEVKSKKSKGKKKRQNFFTFSFWLSFGTRVVPRDLIFQLPSRAACDYEIVGARGGSFLFK